MPVGWPDRSPLATVGPLVEYTMAGWVLGNIVGVVIERRARRRRPGGAADGVHESWALLGAAGGLALAVLDELS
jgi:hypothetical protein